MSHTTPCMRRPHVKRLAAWILFVTLVVCVAGLLHTVAVSHRLQLRLSYLDGYSQGLGWSQCIMDGASRTHCDTTFSEKKE